MAYFVGIDLGTTNSAISTFDGESVRVWKSPEQTDVTPSAIYIDRRGKRFYGNKAYEKSSQQPGSCAVLFKRFMGTNTKLDVAGHSMTPEECSAEILRALFKNLPEEIRESEDVATVITVPAAFNQMQNAATLDAAKQAGLGKVALMQEPVAAIMSVMEKNNQDANFLIYDLGGGTLDIAVAESLNGKVNLLAHGGIAMCGGRDFDRILMDELVLPWLQKNYDLPVDLKTNETYKKLLRMAAYETEAAKIRLSAEDEVQIEGEMGIEDDAGEEIYLDIPLTRAAFDGYIADLVEASIKATKETIEKSGLRPSDMDRIIFIGGPTNYKPLRDKVSAETGIPSSIEVNPMTAVSEGASIYAESIDWNSEGHSRKTSREQIKGADELGLSFRYVSRSTTNQARIGIDLKNDAAGYTFEVKSVDTGWSSGSMQLFDKAVVIVPLNKKGENTFTLAVFDPYGRSIPLAQDRITISYTLATIGAILASHSIGIEVRANSQEGHSTTLDYFVREGDTLPAKGEKVFRAAETIRAGEANSLNFKIWEGEIEETVEDNRFIGYMSITGDDFDYGMIPAGSEIICNYTVDDSGSISLAISVPSISEEFNSDRNFYSRQEGQIDLDHAAAVIRDDGQKTLEKIKYLGEKTNHQYDTELQKAAELASRAAGMSDGEYDREAVKRLSDELLDIKKLLNKIRSANLLMIRQHELDGLKDFFEKYIRPIADAGVADEYSRLFASAERFLERRDSSFENTIRTLKGRNFHELFWHDDEFLVYNFQRLTQHPEQYTDMNKFEELKALGAEAIQRNNIDALREVENALYDIKIDNDENGMDMMANIVKA